MSNYYCLISGLKDILPDDSKPAMSVQAFREEVINQLSTNDKKLFDLFFQKYDNTNLLKCLNNRDAVIDQIGTLTQEDLNEIINQFKEDSHPIDKRIYPYYYQFIPAYLTDTPLSEGVLWEDQLAGLYYNHAISISNDFISSWFELGLNINNILIGIAGRKYHFNVMNVIVGDNEVANAVRNSTSRDFGLGGSFHYLEQLQRIAEEKDLVMCEKRIDALKWEWLDEQTFFHYFSIERVFAYLLKLDMLERWSVLDKETGENNFRSLIAQMKQQVRLPEEFEIRK